MALSSVIGGEGATAGTTPFNICDTTADNLAFDLPLLDYMRGNSVTYWRISAGSNTCVISPCEASGTDIAGASSFSLESQWDMCEFFAPLSGQSWVPRPTSQTDATAVSQALTDHAALARTHGKPSSDLASLADAQQYADDAETNAGSYADGILGTHASDTSTHGVTQVAGVADITANTAALYNQTAASSPLLSAVGTGFLLVADTAYWTYIGQMPRAGSVTGIQFVVTVAAIGTQAAEIAIGTTAAAPTHTGNADITVAADASVSIAGDLTATGYFDESSITYEFTAGAHIWIGIRANFTVGPTQPTLSGLVGDFGRGYVQRTATASVLAEATYAGTVPTPTVTAAALVPSGPALTCEITFI